MVSKTNSSFQRNPPSSKIINHHVQGGMVDPVHPQGEEEDKDIPRTRSSTTQKNYGETMDSVKEALFVFLIRDAGLVV